MKVFTIVIISILCLTLSAFARGKKDESPNAMEGAMMESVEMDDSSMDSDGMMESDSMGGGLADYAGMDKSMMHAESQPVVLFFFADWCPTCKAAIKDLKAREKELGNIQVFIVDYDNSDSLQKKYGVTYQHTFVQIASSGMALSSWNGGDTDEILENTKTMEM